MADESECATWRYQLQEKDSYYNTWVSNQSEALRELDSAIDKKWKADSALTEAQNEVTRAENAVRHWDEKKREADRWVSDLLQSRGDLKWKIDNECH